MKIKQYGKCPECGKSWDGGMIDKKLRKHYHKPYKWSRLIGVEVMGGYDGTSFWQCPDCKAMWDRFNGNKVQQKGYTT